MTERMYLRFLFKDFTQRADEYLTLRRQQKRLILERNHVGKRIEILRQAIEHERALLTVAAQTQEEK